MQYGICLISLAPMRILPDDRSEMVTQVLFGELMQVLEQKEKWLLVELNNDGYQGWISAGQFTFLPDSEYLRLQQSEVWISNDLVQVLESKKNNTRFLVTAGSTFYNCQNNQFTILDEDYIFHGNMKLLTKFQADQLTDNALLFLDCPYLWGGKSAMGIDCSGFTQLVYKISGMNILRDASQQATQGELINLIHEAQPGDMFFFDNDENQINHTGILLDSDYIIHAHQKVRVDKIDHQGIFNAESRQYTHKLRLIKRIML